MSETLRSIIRKETSNRSFTWMCQQADTLHSLRSSSCLQSHECKYCIFLERGRKITVNIIRIPIRARQNPKQQNQIHDLISIGRLPALAAAGYIILYDFLSLPSGPRFPALLMPVACLTYFSELFPGYVFWGFTVLSPPVTLFLS